MTRSNLRVLYLGPDPDEEPQLRAMIPNREKMSQLVRAGEFRLLLEKYFNTVSVVTPAEYNERLSENYDVTLFDAVPRPIAHQYRFGARTPVHLTAGFSQAALCINNITWRLIGRMGLNRKLDHL